MIIVTRTTKMLLRQFFQKKSIRDLIEQLLILFYYFFQYGIQWNAHLIWFKRESKALIQTKNWELYKVLIVRGGMILALFNVGTTVLYA